VAGEGRCAEYAAAQGVFEDREEKPVGA
jgi:hypothetical protein